MESNSRGTRWFITMNNYNEEVINKIRSQVFKDICKYYILGFEEAPTTNTKHFHLYIRLKQKMYRNSLKKLLPNCVIEIAKGESNHVLNIAVKKENLKNLVRD